MCPITSYFINSLNLGKSVSLIGVTLRTCRDLHPTAPVYFHRSDPNVCLLAVRLTGCLIPKRISKPLPQNSFGPGQDLDN